MFSRPIIDWDHANPGRPLEDLAYLVDYTAPLCSDTTFHGPGSPWRMMSPARPPPSAPEDHSTFVGGLKRFTTSWYRRRSMATSGARRW